MQWIKNLVEKRWTGTKVRPVVREEFRNSPVLRRLADCRAKGLSLGMLYFDVVAFRQIEQTHGTRLAASVLVEMTHHLEAAAAKVLGDDQLVAIQHLWGDDYIIYVAQPGAFDPGWLRSTADSIARAAAHRLTTLGPDFIRGPIRLHAGGAQLDGRAGARGIDALVYEALEHARAMAKGDRSVSDLQAFYQLKAILANDRLTSVYQPIVDLTSGTVHGWEALMRGPLGTPLQSPGALIALADDHGQTWALERAARSSAFAGIGDIASESKLFINVNPRCMTDPSFTVGQTRLLLDQAGMSAMQVVVEITEWAQIEDFASFRRLIQHYRDQGYLIAVDDVGAGYSGLRSIAELRPDYLKVDMGLVQGCSSDPVKQAMLEAIVAFAGKIGSKVVAEGIETPEDLRAVMRFGVHMAQGYFLARPASPRPALSGPAAQLIHRVRSGSVSGTGVVSAAEHLVQSTHTVMPETLVRELVAVFEATDSLEGVVVLEGGRPCGLIMQNRFFRRLGIPFGVPLLYDRPVLQVMDPNPLIVEVSTPLEQVARLAGHREHSKRYDLVVLVEHGRYMGVLSVHQLLNAVTDAQLQVARQINPLTDLPGNPLIQAALSRRQQEGKPFSLLYADLDAFKIYNDNYGFERGDQVIRFVARLLRRFMSKFGDETDFLGHIGGDDFLILTTPDRVEAMGTAVMRVFDRCVPRFYCEDDQVVGAMRGYDRQGMPVAAPLMGISIAVVDCSGDEQGKWSQIGARSAELKRRAKAGHGSQLVRGALISPAVTSCDDDSRPTKP